jgi:PAS domain S-box-containing protein
MKTLQMFEVKREDIIGHSPVEFSPELQPDGRKSSDKAREKMKAVYEGKPQSFDWKHKKGNGKLFDTEVALNAIEIQNEVFVQAIVRDVTIRKKAENDLIDSERNFKNIFHSSNDGIIISDVAYNILNANNKVLALLNCNLNELLTRKVTSFIIPGNLQVLPDYLKKTASSDFTGSIEICTMQTNERKVPVEVNTSTIIYGNKSAILIVIRDISERKMLENKILQAIIDTEEKERIRFAKELHDGLGPVLSTIKLYFQWLTQTPDSKKRNQIFKKGKENIEDAIRTLREISNNLSPHILNNFGLCDAVEQFIEKLLVSKGISINFQTNTRDRYRNEIEITFYRIITELINNTIKHAEATEIDIRIETDDNHEYLQLFYTDNGKGFDPDNIRRQRPGLGLFNIENRIETIGGTLTILSKPSGGMSVTASIKIEH